MRVVRQSFGRSREHPREQKGLGSTSGLNAPVKGSHRAGLVACPEEAAPYDDIAHINQ